jgi:hypothetical protein
MKQLETETRELSERDLEAVTGGGVWEALLSFLHGGTDASHTTQSCR